MIDYRSILLYYSKGNNFTQVATICGFSRNTVKLELYSKNLSNKPKLEYVKIRNSDYMFGKSLFDKCENIRKILVEDISAKQSISIILQGKVEKITFSINNEINNDMPF